MELAVTEMRKDRVDAGESGLMLVSDNREALAARVLATRSATSSLDLMYYIWHDDGAGRLLMREVVAAADRGVRVRILLDDINPRKSDAAYLALNAHRNIELKLFNPSGMRNGSLLRGLEMVARLFAMTRRMHTKAWIADGKAAIVGGRNVGDAYFDAAETNFRDLDVLLFGNAVEQTSAIFDQFWNSRASHRVDTLHAINVVADHKELGRVDPRVAAGLLETVGPRKTLDDFIAGGEVVWTRSARVVADPPDKALGRRRKQWLSRTILPVIRSATRRLDVVSPYFIPGRRGTAILADLVRRGAKVSVLTNSLAATDVAAVHGAYANYRVDLLRKGVRLFEFRPFVGKPDISVFGSKGASLHTKAFAVDDTFGFVGSFNFDPRSVSLNAEMGVLFEDSRLVGQLRQCVRREKAPDASYRLMLEEGRLRWEDASDGEARRYATEPRASLFRRVIAAIVGWLPIESQL